MLAKLVLLFVGLPLLEMAILIKLGEMYGFWPTVALVIGTGVLGASLARWQGFQVINQIRGELHAGRLPANELVDGLLIFVGGLVLLTPGLLTDLFGFALLTPPIRLLVKTWLYEKFKPLVRDTGPPFTHDADDQIYN